MKDQALVLTRSLSINNIGLQGGLGIPSEAPINVSKVHTTIPAGKICEDTAALINLKRPQTRINVQMRMLNTETEKTRQKLEQQQHEIEKQIKLLNMED